MPIKIMFQHSAYFGNTLNYNNMCNQIGVWPFYYPIWFELYLKMTANIKQGVEIIYGGKESFILSMSSLVLGCIIINLNFGKCADGIYPKPKIKHIYEYPTELLLRLWYVNDLAISSNALPAIHSSLWVCMATDCLSESHASGFMNHSCLPSIWRFLKPLHLNWKLLLFAQIMMK